MMFLEKVKVSAWINRKYRFLRRECVSIISLQETHICKKDHWLKQFFLGQINHAPGITRTQGIMMGIARNCPWQLKSKGGSWVNQAVTLIAPHTAQATFWKEIFGLVMKEQDANVLFGDLNATFSNAVDRYTIQRWRNCHEHLENLCRFFNWWIFGREITLRKYIILSSHGVASLFLGLTLYGTSSLQQKEIIPFLTMHL